MNQSATGGTFRSRLSAARLFGLIEFAQGRVSLTSLGRDLQGDAKARLVLVEAFLKPPLYRALYDKFIGHVLPPAAAIERQIEDLGIYPRQKGRARQTFMKSAQYAGFIVQATDRFVKPGNGEGAAPRNSEDQTPASTRSRTRGGEPPRHPLVTGLFLSLPKDGESWTLEEAVDWLQAAASNFRLAYKIKGTISVSAAPPAKSQE